MGLGLFKMSKSVCDRSATDQAIELPNPNPKEFTIGSSITIGRFLVLTVLYKGVTTFEGKKILVFENTSSGDLIKQGSIDPHFSENKRYKSPIARFLPTAAGLQMALTFCRTMLGAKT